VAGLIEDYAIIGDTQTAALINIDGSIDWLCVPRFDSGACFSALLGEPEHGRWQLAPANHAHHVERAYRGDSLVLETLYHTNDGVVAVIDFMPPREKEPSVIRIVEGREGMVKMAMEFVLRFDYGSIVPWVQARDGGLACIAGGDAVRLDGPVELASRDWRTFASFDVTAGERLEFALTWYPSHGPRPETPDASGALAFTEKWWADWSSRCTYDGDWGDEVMRSLITLKALTFAPTGGICAAATTSLPEQLGGVRNWDYRYCWLRDASFSLRCLLNNGYHDEAMAWAAWLRRAVAGSPGDFQIMYGVAGERRLTEFEVDWLPGYESSAPVRVGNGASEQFQLDVFGEVMDVGHIGRELRLSGQDWADRIGVAESELEFESWGLQKALMEHLEQVWRQPDDGIWEVRGPRRHFTHSKMMAWVAADRAVCAIEDYGRDGPLERWRTMRDDIHRDVCENGYNAGRHAFVQSYGSDALDASLLMMPMVGFLPATDPRVVGTVEAIQRELTTDGFVKRYQTDEGGVDGLPEGEGAFLMTSFWLVDNLALMGRRSEATELFEQLRSLQNDVGLFAEEYDVGTSRMVGNFPQAFSHVAFVNSATNLSKLEHEGGDVLPSQRVAPGAVQ
jgi:GH15 family glucan-1,4-alpha-glucosidase